MQAEAARKKKKEGESHCPAEHTSRIAHNSTLLGLGMCEGLGARTRGESSALMLLPWRVIFLSTSTDCATWGHAVYGDGYFLPPRNVLERGLHDRLP